MVRRALAGRVYSARVYAPIIVGFYMAQIWVLSPQVQPLNK